MQDVNTLALMHGVSGCGVPKQVRHDILIITQVLSRVYNAGCKYIGVNARREWMWGAETSSA
jgi:hypothetical protein